MSHVSKLLWLSCLVFTFACTVPPIEELEKDRATECNAEHPCPPKDFVCFENRCIYTPGLGCKPGDNQVCDTSRLGVCSQGTSQCNAKGEWGDCQVTVTGGSEVCDGKDNDCDGSTDEQLTQECTKTYGVCRGAVESCSGGAYAGCTDATYLAHNVAYQRYETRCDGLDNDCDNRPDAWASIPLVAEHTSQFLDAIAVKPSSGREGVLTLTGEANGLVARLFTDEGILNTGAKFPAPASNIQFLSPALVEERDTVVAAWIERTTPSGSPSTYRVLMTLLDAAGNRIANVPILNVAPYNESNTHPSRLWLEISQTHILLVVETLPEGFGARELWALTVTRDFRSRSTPLKLGGSSISNWGPALTTNITRDVFLVAYEDSNGRATMGRISGQGVLTNIPGPSEGSFVHSPFIVSTDINGSFDVYYVNWPDPTSGTDKSELMQVSCSSTECGTPKVLATYFHHVLGMQMVARPGMRAPDLALLRWEDSQPTVWGLSIATFFNGAYGKTADLSQVGPERTYSEVLAFPPGGGPRLVYLQQVPGIGVPPRANLLPFCP